MFSAKQVMMIKKKILREIQENNDKILDTG